jgi:hypothetical protein
VMRINDKSGMRAQNACVANIIQIGKPILIYDPCSGLSLGFGAGYFDNRWRSSSSPLGVLSTKRCLLSHNSPRGENVVDLMDALKKSIPGEAPSSSPALESSRPDIWLK